MTGEANTASRSAYAIRRAWRGAGGSVSGVGGTFGELFCGGGLAAIGLRQAGLTPAWAIDTDQAAADCYEANHGAHVIRRPVESVDPRTLAPIDALWCSPPCPSYSQARNKALPSRGDKWLGLAILPYIEIHRPRIVLLENVPPYAGSECFSRIVAALFGMGYMVDWCNVDASEHGVPQSRNRLIMRALRGELLPPLPAPLAHIGWYAAIADLIPSLPESAFAPWQLKRLADHPLYSFLLMTGNTNIEHPTGTGVLAGGSPANTVMESSCKARAWLVSGTDAAVRSVCGPAHTVTATLHEHTAMPRALLLHPTASHSDTFPVRGEGDPAMTVRTQGGMPRALLVDGQNAGRAISDRDSTEPSFVCTNGGKAVPRAILVDCTSSERVDESGYRALTNRQGTDAAFTVTAGADGRGVRAGLEAGRVVSMTPRALARFQGVPDSFVLPSRKADACRILGNGVAVGVARRIAEGLLSHGR